MVTVVAFRVITLKSNSIRLPAIHKAAEKIETDCY